MSTLRVSNLQNEASANNQITLGTDGFAQINGVAMPTAGPLSSRNLIVNGGMAVSQRGTSQASVSDGSNEGYTTVDRFPFYFSSGTGGAATLSQSTDVPSNQGFSNSYKADVTTSTTLSAGNTIIMQYLVEAQDMRNSGWNFTDPNSFITLSFWAKSSKSGTHCVFFDVEDASNNQHRNEEYTLTAGTWEKITIPLPGHANLLFNNDNGRGLNIQWLLASSASATAGEWVDSGDRGTSNQVNIFDSTDGEFFLTGVQLEVGQVATPFEHRSYGDELRRCQRYFQGYDASDATARAAISYDNYDTDASSDLQATTLIGAGTVVDGDDARIYLSFPVAMRTRPTVTASDIRLITDLTLHNTATTVQTNSSSIYGLSLLVDNASTMTAGQCAHLIIKGNGNLFFDAEI